MLAMPFVVTNLGGEMIYILEQRLRAQNIPGDKSVKVLHDVVKTMFSGKFISEVFRPAEIYSNTSTRQIFEKLAHSSIMRLSESSMDKLYDLMTQGFKYQLLSCKQPQDILQVTFTHTQTILSFINDPGVMEMVKSAERTIQTTYQNLSPGDWVQLRHALCGFFHDRRIKVSLFLQEGIQAADGRIVLPPPEVAGTSAPVGQMRLYNSAGVATETEQVKLAEIGNAGNHPVQLGGNLYAKDRTPVKRSAAVPTVKAAAPPASTDPLLSQPQESQSFNSAVSSSSLSSIGMDNTPAQHSMASPARPQATTKDAKDELNLLASLIGPAAKPSDSFKINLFPDTGSSAPQPAQKGPHVDTITFNITSNTGLDNLMKDFNSSVAVNNNDDQDDLLDLMDSA